MLFIFDMGGVVTNTFKSTQLSEWLGISIDDFNRIGGKFHELLDVGEITVKEFWDLFYKNAIEQGFSIPEIKNDLFRLTFHPVLNEKTVEIIKKLRKNHRVVCGTNTIDSHWENHLERGDYSYFDQTYASNKIGVAKPSHEFYELIMKAEGFCPEETFFTDDKIENILAAEKLGINVHQFISAEKLQEEWKKYF